MEAAYSGLVSLIIPVFNSGRYSGSILKSILDNQNEIGEVVLVNDGGSIEDFTYLSKFLESHSFNLVALTYEMNQGPWFARNHGVEHAKYSIIAFLDSDDVLPPDSIRSRRDILLGDQGAKFVSSSYKWLSNESIQGHNLVLDRFGKNDLLQTCFVCTPSVIMRKNVFSSVGGFRNIRAEDFDLWLRVLDEEKSYALGDNSSHVLIRKSSGSVSSNKILSMSWHVKVLRHHVLSNRKRIVYIAIYLVNVIRRRILKIKAKPIILKN